MSMKFSDFIKQVGADPRSRDPEVLHARNSSPEFKRIAKEAEAFEDKLQAALLIDPPAELLNQIRQIGQQPTQRRNWIPLALAASLVLAVSAVTVFWKQYHQWDSVETYLVDHYSHDGNELVARASGPMSESDISKIMTSLGAFADRSLSSKIMFIKYCPTPGGRGAHMVVSTDQGLITVIYMPKAHVIDNEKVRFDRMHAVLVELDQGSVAIIGEQSQSIDNLQSTVRRTLKTGLIRT